MRNPYENGPERPVHDGVVNPVSPVIVVFFLIMLGLEMAFTLGTQGMVGGPTAVGWRVNAIQDYGMNGAVFDWMWEQGRYPWQHLIRFVTYLFLFYSFTHFIVAGVMMLALGKFVGEVFAWWAVAVVFVGSGIGGAFAWGLFLSDPGFLVGAFPGVYGLIGAFSFILWLRLGQAGENQFRAFTLIGFLMVIQLVFGVLFGARGDWLADIAGFIFGFLLSFVVSPGGWARVRAKLRHG